VSGYVCSVLLSLLHHLLSRSSISPQCYGRVFGTIATYHISEFQRSPSRSTETPDRRTRCVRHLKNRLFFLAFRSQSVLLVPFMFVLRWRTTRETSCEPFLTPGRRRSGFCVRDRSRCLPTGLQVSDLTVEQKKRKNVSDLTRETKEHKCGTDSAGEERGITPLSDRDNERAVAESRGLWQVKSLFWLVCRCFRS